MRAINSLIAPLRKPYGQLMFIAFFYDTIIFYVIWILQKLPIISFFALYIVPTLIVALLFVMRKTKVVNACIRPTAFLFILAVIACVLVSYMVHPNTQAVIEERYIDILFSKCIPYFCVGLLMKTDDDTIDFLGKMSEISLIIGLVYLYYMLNISSSEAITSDNMSLAYNYMLVEMLCIVYAFRRNKISAWVMTIIGFIMLFMLGTRGPVLLTVAHFVLCFVKHFMQDKRKRGITLVVSGLTLALIYVFYDAIIQLLILITANAGLSTRVFEKLLSEEIFQSTARSDITNLLLKKIADKPILGYGIAGEWEFVNWNAHNMYVSFGVQFGIILGTILICCMICMAYRTYKTSNDDNEKYILIMLICMVFPKGLFGSEPLSMEVFFLVGFCMSRVAHRKLQRRESLEVAHVAQKEI